MCKEQSILSKALAKAFLDKQDAKVREYREALRNHEHGCPECNGYGLAGVLFKGAIVLSEVSNGNHIDAR